MKFEKLTDTKIRIVFNIDDMNSNNFSADTFFSDNSIAQSALNSILSMAEKEIGFKADDCKLLIEAISSNDGDFIFTITKLYSYELHNAVYSSILRFDCFENFVSLCTYLKNINSFNFYDFLRNCCLFKLNNIYYLCINSAYELPNLLVNSFTEFSSCINYNSTLDGILSEYGTLIFNGKFNDNSFNTFLNNFFIV